MKLVSTLEMYGVTYFEIRNKKNTELWLGIDAFGLKFYSKEQKLKAETAFKWSEIKDVLIKGSKFNIKLNDHIKSHNLQYSTTIYVKDHKLYSKIVSF